MYVIRWKEDGDYFAGRGEAGSLWTPKQALAARYKSKTAARRIAKVWDVSATIVRLVPRKHPGGA